MSARISAPNFSSPASLTGVCRTPFGDKAYAFEELVAELGAAFMCSAFSITNEPRPDHAAYLASWLEVLNKDAGAIFTAANRAQEAIQYLGELASAKLDPRPREVA